MLDPATFARLCEARDRLRRADDEPPLTIRDIAAKSGLSAYRFIRLFKGLFGETPGQFRTRARLDHAKLLLAFEEKDVTTICMDVGFSSLGTFSDLFAKRVGAAPTGFRRVVRDAMPSPTELPPSMTPGCVTLMAGPPGAPQFSRSALRARARKLRTR